MRTAASPPGVAGLDMPRAKGSRGLSLRAALPGPGDKSKGHGGTRNSCDAHTWGRRQGRAPGPGDHGRARLAGSWELSYFFDQEVVRCPGLSWADSSETIWAAGRNERGEVRPPRKEHGTRPNCTLCLGFLICQARRILAPTRQLCWALTGTAGLSCCSAQPFCLQELPLFHLA